MIVIVIILRVIFTIPVLVFFLACRITARMIAAAGAAFESALVHGGELIASIMSSVLFGALCICIFGIDGIGFLKTYWYMFVIAYLVSAMMIGISVLYLRVAQGIEIIGEWLVELVCPWLEFV